MKKLVFPVLLLLSITALAQVQQISTPLPVKMPCDTECQHLWVSPVNDTLIDSEYPSGGYIISPGTWEEPEQHEFQNIGRIVCFKCYKEKQRVYHKTWVPEYNRKKAEIEKRLDSMQKIEKHEIDSVIKLTGKTILYETHNNSGKYLQTDGNGVTSWVSYKELVVIENKKKKKSKSVK